MFVLGNHDFYGEHLDELPRELIAAGAPLLTANRPLEFGGYTFVGGTLFSNFRLPWVNKKQFRENLALARRNIADFSTSPQAKRRTSAAPNPKTTSSALMPNSISSSISATERAPSCSPTFRCTAPQYADSPLNPYFINQIDVAGFDCWIAGHTHQAVDTVQDGCRLIINPLGYPNEYGANAYRDGLLLELPDLQITNAV